MPAPAQVGAVLEDDAAVLVPQTAGAQWRFWGVQYGAADAVRARYETSYRLTASGTGWMLTGTNPGNDGADSLRYVLASGQMQQIETVQFTASQPPEEVRITLLKSPVRVGDQTLAYNKRIEGVPDQDGDGRADSVDVAIYTRVTGQEKVETALGEQLDAVRVETHLVQRILYSRTGQPGPVVDIVGVDWFARGLGWVARQQPVLSADGQVLTGQERLVGADVGPRGYGNAGGPVQLVNPPSSPEQAGQPLEMLFPSAVTNGDRVLLIGSPAVPDFSYRPLLTLLNERGEVQWTRLGPAGARFAQPLGTGWVLWGNLDNGQAVIFRLDAQGQLLTGGPQVLDLGTPQSPLPSTHRGLRIAGDGNALWVASVRLDWVLRATGGYGLQDALVVRGFDLQGMPLTAPLVLDRTAVGASFQSALSLGVRQGQAVLGWVSTNDVLPRLMLAQVSSTGALLTKEVTGFALSASTGVDVAGAPTGALLAWDSSFAWVDEALGVTLLDATRSDGKLRSLPVGIDGLLSGTFVRRGDRLLHWNIGSSINSGTVNGTTGAVLQWQLYQRGQAAPQRRSFVMFDPRPLVVPLSDRLLVISAGNRASSWNVEQIRW